MPVSKKPRKKAASKKKGSKADNVIDFPSDLRGVEQTLAGIAGIKGDRDPVGQAQSIMYDAWDSADPKDRISLARKALDISPLCADAYVLLAEENAQSLEEALEYYQKGVQAGEEALGPHGFKEYAGHFWGFLETRPYMRARFGLAEALWAMGKQAEAVTHLQEMLVLNPGDNQGIRYVLAAKLLAMDDLTALKAHLKQFEDEVAPDLIYTRALVAFREGSPKAVEFAQTGWHCNQHVPAMLSGRIPQEEMTGYISMGGKDEATSYVLAFGEAWKATPGAIAWLEKVTKDLKVQKL